MLSSMKSLAICLGAALALALILPAGAADWSKTGPNGGEISHSGMVNGRFYSGSTSAIGPNGATFSSSTSCVEAVVDRCYRSYSGTGAKGKSFSGESASAYGPFGRRSVASFPGPNGRTVHGFRWVRR